MSTSTRVNARKGHQGFHETEKTAPSTGLSGLQSDVGNTPETVLLSPDGQFVEFDGERTQLVEKPWGPSLLASGVGQDKVFTYTTYSQGDFYVHTEQHNHRGIVAVNVEQADRIESLGDEARTAHDALVAKTFDEDTQMPQPAPAEDYVSPYGPPSKTLAGNDGSPSRPVDYRDARIQKGERFDTVAGEGGTTFHRRRDGVYAGTPYAMRFQSSKEISDEEMRHAAQLIGYQYASTVRGERMPAPVRDSPYSFILAADTTKSRSDDLGMAMEDFERDLQSTLQYGSPERTTNRSGEGTKGTRLVPGLGNYAPNLDIYYDDAHAD